MQLSMEGFRKAFQNIMQKISMASVLHENVNLIFRVAFNGELQWRWIQQGFSGDGMNETLK
jgi:hypothetical protein